MGRHLTKLSEKSYNKQKGSLTSNRTLKICGACASPKMEKTPIVSRLKFSGIIVLRELALADNFEADC
jgi:hypothetical protein